MMQLKTNYDLVEYTMVVVILKSLLIEKILDLRFSLVPFVSSAAILLLICKANLTLLCLKCASEKSSFKWLVSPNTSNTLPLCLYKNRDTPTANVNTQNGGVMGMGLRMSRFHCYNLPQRTILIFSKFKTL